MSYFFYLFFLLLFFKLISYEQCKNLANESFFHLLYQIPTEEVLSKKEQITEALRNTQQILTKHSDKYVTLFFSHQT